MSNRQRVKVCEASRAAAQFGFPTNPFIATGPLFIAHPQNAKEHLRNKSYALVPMVKDKARRLGLYIGETQEPLKLAHLFREAKGIKHKGFKMKHAVELLEEFVSPGTTSWPMIPRNDSNHSRALVKALTLSRKPAKGKKLKSRKPKPLPVEGFYFSREWRAVRYAVVVRCKGACDACGRSVHADGIKIHIDHIKPRSKYPHLELEPTNLQALCEDCNLGKSNSDETDWRATA